MRLTSARVNSAVLARPPRSPVRDLVEIQRLIDGGSQSSRPCAASDNARASSPPRAAGQWDWRSLCRRCPARNRAPPRKSPHRRRCCRRASSRDRPPVRRPNRRGCRRTDWWSPDMSNCHGFSTSFMAQASMMTVSRMNLPLYLRSYSSSPVSRKIPGQGLHDVGLVNDGHLFSARRNRVLEGKFAAADGCPGGVLTPVAMATRVRVIVDWNVGLVPDVQALEVFAHDDQVNLVESAAGNQRARRSQIGIELELLHASAHWRIGSRRPKESRAAL